MASGHVPPEDFGGADDPARPAGAPSLDALLIHYLPRLRAFVRVRANPLVREIESCSDVVQSVCREVLQGASRFEYRGEAPFRAWLFRTALNKILERTRSMTQRKRDVRREVRTADYGDLAAVGPTASQVAAAGELSEQMERAFDLIPDQYREVIALSRIVGLPNAEIAAQLGRSEGAVRVLLSRALVAYVGAIDRVRGGA